MREMGEPEVPSSHGSERESEVEPGIKRSVPGESETKILSALAKGPLDVKELLKRAEISAKSLRKNLNGMNQDGDILKGAKWVERRRRRGFEEVYYLPEHAAMVRNGAFGEIYTKERDVVDVVKKRLNERIRELKEASCKEVGLESLAQEVGAQPVEIERVVRALCAKYKVGFTQGRHFYGGLRESS